MLTLLLSLSILYYLFEVIDQLGLLHWLQLRPADAAILQASMDRVDVLDVGLLAHVLEGDVHRPAKEPYTILHDNRLDVVLEIHLDIDLALLDSCGILR